MNRDRRERLLTPTDSELPIHAVAASRRAASRLSMNDDATQFEPRCQPPLSSEKLERLVECHPLIALFVALALGLLLGKLERQ